MTAKTLPVSIREPEIRELVAGAMTVLIRPAGRLAALGPGDLLWVREPFHVGRAFDHLKPTAAAAQGAVPIFIADRSPAWLAHRSAELGGRGMAREMPKAWHRQHLRIMSIDRVALHSVSDRDLRTAGWKSRAAFRARWDADASFHGRILGAPNLWDANPQILRIVFERIAGPLPGYDPANPRSTARSAASPRAASNQGMAGSFIDRSPCPRCGVRRDRGCEHHPQLSETLS